MYDTLRVYVCKTSQNLPENLQPGHCVRQAEFHGLLALTQSSCPVGTILVGVVSLSASGKSR